MTGGRIKEDINEESFGGADADAEEGVLISDDKAAQIFDILKQANDSKPDKPRKIWNDDEYLLLMWAINQYCTRQNLTPKKMTKDDWV